MEWRKLSFDWNQARAFLATAEEGSLSAAARALGMTQPTLGRQVAALESDLGVTLFQRVGRSLELTPAGLELLEHVREMGEAANRISLTASGQSEAIDGEVCIAATHIVATVHLPPILRRLADVAPGISVEVRASGALSDLRRREADIAIRHARPEQPDLVAKLVREVSVHFYASNDYVARRGMPKTPADLADAPFIVSERSQRMVEWLNGVGVPATRDAVHYVSEDSNVIWAMVQAGLGVTILDRDSAAMKPGIVDLLPGMTPIKIPMWLVAHRELNTSRRIRLVFDLLAEGLAKPPEPF
ncbi:MAG: LysR family transcriptional regulator [Pseudomonadota bacterium]